MQTAIIFILSNFTLTMLVLGLIASAIAIARAPRPTREVVVEKLFAYFLLFSIFLSLTYNFVMHVFFGDMAARFIGWAQSPFQAEVGFASLGFAVVGLLAFFGNRVGFGSRRSWGRRCSIGRGGRPHLPDDHRAQLCARQRRDHLLDRYHSARDRVCLSVAPKTDRRRSARATVARVSDNLRQVFATPRHDVLIASRPKIGKG